MGQEGRLFIIEGPTGSGKSELAKVLAEQGYKTLRGMPSQDPYQNLELVPDAVSMMRGVPVNFQEILTSHPAVQTLTLERFIKCSTLQFQEALKLKAAGHTTFLERSTISLAALMYLGQRISRYKGLPDQAARLGQEGDKIVKLMDFSGADGIILMTQPIAQASTRAGMAGLEEEEAISIREVTTAVHMHWDLPILLLDASHTSVPEEVIQIRNFIEKVA